MWLYRRSTPDNRYSWPMRVIDNLENFWHEQTSILTIGAFDGIHRGHQALVRQVIERAQWKGCQSGVVTFFPHPVNVLFPERGVQCITTPGEKAAILERFGLDMMVLIQFTPELAALPAGQFVNMLVDHLHPTELWVGRDFTFGKEREGDVAFLQEMGPQAGFDVHVLEPIQWKGNVVSSSRIRRLLAGGEMEEVADLLGRYYALTGEVVPGPHRGQTLGFPTANLKVRSERALPCDGVYACFALVGRERFPAVANLGIRPTFDDANHLLEVYLIDVDIDLYGCDLGVEFVHRMRPESRFKSMDDLIEQIQADVAEARRLLIAARHTEPDLIVPDWVAPGDEGTAK